MTRGEREAAVDWFAEQMKAKLREPRNEAKGGWREDPPSALRWRLLEEVSELNRAMNQPASSEEPIDFDGIVSECCDVSNFAMMIADRLRMLKEGT